MKGSKFEPFICLDPHMKGLIEYGSLLKQITASNIETYALLTNSVFRDHDSVTDNCNCNTSQCYHLSVISSEVMCDTVPFTVPFCK